ncbi:c-type cytochrome [Neoaquamicrobium sediminum]|uniref:C-type cytochrome n=1 Tax=Neoaquamicrobium sediminum TaxID=1849104 RepID=A0ABV3X0E1_9HYPH
MKTTLAIGMAAIVSLILGASAQGAELRGHGGPVRAIAIAGDGRTAITGSFDAKAIIWSLETGEAREVLLFHDDQVDAVASLPDGRFASAGADGRIAIWEDGRSAPVSVLEGHTGPVAALAVSPDGATLASASWDASVRLWPLSGGEPLILEGHRGNVNAVAFLSDGTLASAGHDAAVILWPPERDTTPVRADMPVPLSALVATADDRLFAGGVDGKMREVDRDGVIRGEIAVSTGPVTALAASEDGGYIAASSVRGGITLLDAGSLTPIRTLGAAGVPVWSLAFSSDGRTLLAGGADRIVREWDAGTGQQLGTAPEGPADPMAEYAGSPGAEVFRACVACHTLDPDDGNRAGPTLHGIFGRRIASVPDYRYSPAFREMDIVWTPETVSKLFEVGPTKYTPGTKMPEQTISNPEDRAALIRFLQAETRD